MFNLPGLYYTGADLSGTILFDAPGIPVYKKTFEGHVPTPFSIFGGYSDPSGAPFNEAFRKPGSFISAILEIIGEVYGPKPVIIAIKDNDPEVREEASEALVKIGKPAVEPLILALKDRDSDVRKKATDALGEIKDSRAVEPLISTLRKDKDSGVRANAAWELGEIKDSRAVEPLIDALKDENSLIRLFAALALRAITGQDFGEDPIKWQKWWEKNKAK